MKTVNRETEVQLELTPQQAARLAGVSLPVLNSWIRSGLLSLRKGPSGRGHQRVLHEPAVLAVMLLKILRARSVPIEQIRPMSTFLSMRSREQLIREIEAGNEVLYSASGRVGFAKPDGAVKNDTGEATVLLAVDLVALSSRLLYAIEQHNERAQMQERREAAAMN